MVSKEAKTPGMEAADAAVEGRRLRAFPVFVKSALSTLVLGGAIAAVAYTLPHGVARQGDEISQSDVQARLAAFQALAAMDLSVVANEDLNRAVQSMNLDPGAAEALRRDVSDAAPPPKTVPGPQDMQAAQREAPLSSPMQAEAKANRLQLVWITLWDTDVEDGDMVRIDSQGYSRTVRLTKKGDTFAMPVPADGVIKIKGVKDGDGGGITVGLASGSARAIFPVMSEGQELGLRVKVN
ncbi:hypothetical protein [Dyella sp.]|uniref:hypothetical protein n=1 Tax=Dyella sp. TaxID=1869338 RepID=UPI002B479847|nr:hypothetical protein [Dyella sp.]HKT27235.1 hypothetical protein [Dyella sp.]